VPSARHLPFSPLTFIEVFFHLGQLALTLAQDMSSDVSDLALVLRQTANDHADSHLPELMGWWEGR